MHVPRGLTLQYQQSSTQPIHLFHMKLATNMDISPVRNEQTGLSNENTLCSWRGTSESLHNVKYCHRNFQTKQ